MAKIRLLMLIVGVIFQTSFGDEDPFKGPQGKVVEKTDWPGQYATVVAMTYDYTQEEAESIVVGDRIHRGLIATSKELTDDQKKQLFAAITGKHEPWKSLWCFEPHHGFVFYDAKGKIVGSISLCFGCRAYQIQPEGEVSLRWDLVALKKLLKELKMPVLDREDAQSPKAYEELYRNRKSEGK